MVGAAGFEPAASPSKLKDLRQPIALNREVGPENHASRLAQLAEVLSNLAPEDKALLAALLLGKGRGDGQ